MSKISISMRSKLVAAYADSNHEVIAPYNSTMALINRGLAASGRLKNRVLDEKGHTVRTHGVVLTEAGVAEAQRSLPPLPKRVPGEFVPVVQEFVEPVRERDAVLVAEGLALLGEVAEWDMRVGVLREDARLVGRIGLANVRQAVVSGVQRGQRAERLASGEVRVGYSFFAPVVEQRGLSDRWAVCTEGGVQIAVVEGGDHSAAVAAARAFAWVRAVEERDGALSLRRWSVEEAAAPRRVGVLVDIVDEGSLRVGDVVAPMNPADEVRTGTWRVKGFWELGEVGLFRVETDRGMPMDVREGETLLVRRAAVLAGEGSGGGVPGAEVQGGAAGAVEGRVGVSGGVWRVHAYGSLSVLPSEAEAVAAFVVDSTAAGYERVLSLGGAAEQGSPGAVGVDTEEVLAGVRKAVQQPGWCVEHDGDGCVRLSREGVVVELRPVREGGSGVPESVLERLVDEAPVSRVGALLVDSGCSPRVVR
ncbi:hypothetical protein ACFZAM_31875 [Streptomyces sp. NPDC008079]|uniref:hypothetical protein n=1 Tax=Streptomyces sp. NPDC008079 TaxID=3364806 RepID=UPI0036E3816B